MSPSPSLSSAMGLARPRWFVPMLVVLIVLLAAAGYAWKGAPQLAVGDRAALQAMADQAAASSANPGENTSSSDRAAEIEQIRSMVGQARERLDKEPNNAEGWTMLARAYQLIGNLPEAVNAYRRVVKLLPNDASVVADLADVLAVSNGQSLQGEPTALIDRALKLDPKHPKALAMAGKLAYDRQDFAGAARLWEQVVAQSPDHPMAGPLREAVADAKQKAGLAGNSSSSPAKPATPPIAAATARIRGTISLSPTLVARVQPDDVLFVVARPAEGSRMPLAVLRKQVKDLPLAYTLDDSLAMSPDHKLSGAARVVVQARISRSGQAAPQAGDLTAESAALDIKPDLVMDLVIDRLIEAKGN